MESYCLEISQERGKSLVNRLIDLNSRKQINISHISFWCLKRCIGDEGLVRAIIFLSSASTSHKAVVGAGLGSLALTVDTQTR